MLAAYEDMILGYKNQYTRSKLGIGISSRIDGNHLKNEVNLGFDEDMTNLKLVVVIVEDGLVYPKYRTYLTSTGAIDRT